MTPRLILLALLAAVAGAGQTGQKSPAQLIRYLAYQDGRRTNPARELGQLDCGMEYEEAREDRAAAAALVKFGPAAMPNIGAALDSIEQRGERSESYPAVGWLLYSYAKIQGKLALPRLNAIRRNRRLKGLQATLDNAVALVRGYTSYVSAAQGLIEGPIFYCYQQAPSDALNRLILAWMLNRRSALRSELGPHASAALGTILREEPWDDLRTQMGASGIGGNSALGYQLSVPGPWSEPPETLEDKAQVDPRGFATTVSFKSRSGADCGKLPLTFLTVRGPDWNETTFLIDDVDLGQLLRSITVCATSN